MRESAGKKSLHQLAKRAKADDPIAALVTPPGRGGLAVVTVADGEAPVASLFKGQLREGEVSYGKLVDRDELLDEVLAVRRGRMIDLSGHGGPAVVARILAALGRHGIRTVEPRELLKRQGLDPIQIEALEHLPKARTLLTARVLADQLGGALSMAKPSKRLLATARFGLALVNPLTVVLIGRPNVGKSTLFNALVESDRAIVSPEPGTTRDPVREIFSLDGVPVWLVDTAGVREARDEIEQAAISRTSRAASSADLTIHVRVAGQRERGFSVINKCDLRRGRGFNISAKTGEGVDRLRAEILRRLRLGPIPNPGAPVIFTERQRRLFTR